MHEYWILVRNQSGQPFRAIVFASNNYEAIQLAKSMYGRDLISESANFIK